MDLVKKLIQMDQYILANGKIILETDMDFLFRKMEIIHMLLEIMINDKLKIILFIKK